MFWVSCSQAVHVDLGQIQLVEPPSTQASLVLNSGAAVEGQNPSPLARHMGLCFMREKSLIHPIHWNDELKSEPDYSGLTQRA